MSLEYDRVIIFLWKVFKKVTKRRVLGNYLKKLPNWIFPSYRSTINHRLVKSNRKSLMFDQRLPKNCCRYCNELFHGDDSEEEIPARNPLSQIKADELNRVKLRPTPSASRPPPANELLHVLKRRYAAMHSPSPKRSPDLSPAYRLERRVLLY